MTGSLSDISVAILAGGRGTRLGDLTNNVPKALLPIAGKPFLAHQFQLLRHQGIRRVVVCVGHLGDMIIDTFGDGRGHGLQIEYSFDGRELLGTGGSVRNAISQLGECFYVLYGDSYVSVSFSAVLTAFSDFGKQGLMTVYRNEGRLDESNVAMKDGQVVEYRKGNGSRLMDYIDYGVSMFHRSAFDGWPKGSVFDLSIVFQNLIERHQLASFEVSDRFYEIGSPSGLVELSKLLSSETDLRR